MTSKKSVTDIPVLDLDLPSQQDDAEVAPAGSIADEVPAGPIGVTITADDENGDTENPLALAALAYVPPPAPPAPHAAAPSLPAIREGVRELALDEQFCPNAQDTASAETTAPHATAEQAKLRPLHLDNALTAEELVHRTVESVLVRTPRALAAQGNAAPACLQVLLPNASANDDAGPLVVVAGLYEGVLDALGEAAGRITSDQHSAAIAPLRTAADVVGELQSLLDAAVEPEISGDLDRVYAYCRRRMMEAHLAGESGPLEEVIRLLTPLRDAWLETQPPLPHPS